MRVLVIDDEVRLANNIAEAFRQRCGFAVDCANDGADGLALAEFGHYDLLLVDLMLPGVDGLGIVQRLRRRNDKTPILILTARDERAILIELLNAGADDYLTKPFDLGELFARAKALIRRAKGASHSVLTVGRIRLNSVERTVHCNDNFVALSPTEYRLLEYLIHRPRATISGRELVDHLYDYNWEHHSNVIEAHVSNIRKKLRGAGEEDSIMTIRGHGYRLVMPKAIPEKELRQRNN